MSLVFGAVLTCCKLPILSCTLSEICRGPASWTEPTHAPHCKQQIDRHPRHFSHCVGFPCIRQSVALIDVHARALASFRALGRIACGSDQPQHPVRIRVSEVLPALGLLATHVDVDVRGLKKQHDGRGACHQGLRSTDSREQASAICVTRLVITMRQIAASKVLACRLWNVGWFTCLLANTQAHVLHCANT